MKPLLADLWQRNYNGDKSEQSTSHTDISQLSDHENLRWWSKRLGEIIAVSMMIFRANCVVDGCISRCLHVDMTYPKTNRRSMPGCIIKIAKKNVEDKYESWVNWDSFKRLYVGHPVHTPQRSCIWCWKTWEDTCVCDREVMCWERLYDTLWSNPSCRTRSMVEVDGDQGGYRQAMHDPSYVCNTT
jgi:hypothetical protein